MTPEPTPWWKRVAWLIVLWSVSVATVGAVALVLRYWLGA